MSSTQFIVTTTPSIPNYKITKTLGIVCGLTIRSRGLGGHIVADLEQLLGGEVSAYTEEMLKARDEALQRAVEQAKSLGANAIVGLDFETSNISGTAIMISATGTAVIAEPNE
ncbi:MAG: YbjQ family protein [Thermoproteota archaeon]